MDIRISVESIDRITAAVEGPGAGDVILRLSPCEDGRSISGHWGIPQADGAVPIWHPFNPGLTVATEDVIITDSGGRELRTYSAVCRPIGTPPCRIHGHRCAGYATWDCVARVWVAQADSCKPSYHNTPA